MSTPFAEIPELSSPTQIVRIPPELDVPITDRVRAILDTSAMQRLKRISQLGLVSFVYPGAVHSRFEHSLGVFRLACIALRQLAQSQPEAMGKLCARDIKTFLLASLLHDVGHWPYCHPIEDMKLAGIPSHEQAARDWMLDDELAGTIKCYWDVVPDEVADFLTKRSQDPAVKTLQNLLNGPVDIDKMDYLQRDSLHAGVPYGRNFDVSRLISSLRLADNGTIAVSPKGKTAAEMMVFSRYVMFSEVYWHHGVRSATAMLQRAVYRLRNSMNYQDWFGMSDADFQSALHNAISRHESIGGLRSLGHGLFGKDRHLFKRLAQFNFSTAPQVHSVFAHRPFEQLVASAEQLAEKLSKRCGLMIAPDELLIDAPPVKLEIQFRLSIESPNGLMPLANVSPVVRALATDQFDQFVKMVRVFVAPPLRQRIALPETEIAEMLLSCA